MKNILITGVSGYLGQRLVNELKAHENVNKIIGLDVAPLPEASNDIIFYQMDIRDTKLKDILQDHKIDTVYHLAFIVQPIHDKELMHEVDYKGTQNVLNSSVSSQVKQVIAISSTLGYGAYPDNPPKLKENDTMRGNKNFPYGYEKGVVDNMIQDFASKNKEMIITTLRPCTVFGPNVQNYIYRMLFQPFTIKMDDNDPPFQFVHEDDFVRSCIVAMEKQVPGPFNIAGDGTLRTSEISKMIGTKKEFRVKAWFVYPMHELMWKLKVKAVESNSGILDYVRFPFVADNEKAKNELDFYPEHSTIETLHQTIDARKKRKAEKKAQRDPYRKKKNILQKITQVKRKNTYDDFTFGNKIINSLLLILFFITGFNICSENGFLSTVMYLGLWVLSYYVIYAGTCRYCAYYGKSCPIPLEGSMVDRFFEKKEGFGAMQLVWAFVAYFLRIILPLVIGIELGLYKQVGVFLLLYVLFMVFHQKLVGCPNCLNKNCPLNPDYGIKEIIS